MASARDVLRSAAEEVVDLEARVRALDAENAALRAALRGAEAAGDERLGWTLVAARAAQVEEALARATARGDRLTAVVADAEAAVLAASEAVRAASAAPGPSARRLDAVADRLREVLALDARAHARAAYLGERVNPFLNASLALEASTDRPKSARVRASASSLSSSFAASAPSLHPGGVLCVPIPPWESETAASLHPARGSGTPGDAVLLRTDRLLEAMSQLADLDAAFARLLATPHDSAPSDRDWAPSELRFSDVARGLRRAVVTLASLWVVLPPLSSSSSSSSSSSHRIKSAAAPSSLPGESPGPLLPTLRALWGDGAASDASPASTTTSASTSTTLTTLPLAAKRVLETVVRAHDESTRRRERALELAWRDAERRADTARRDARRLARSVETARAHARTEASRLVDLVRARAVPLVADIARGLDSWLGASLSARQRGVVELWQHDLALLREELDAVAPTDR